MAGLSKETPKTSWGDVHAELGTPTDGVMATNMEDLGSIDTDALTIETADGTVHQLKDINGRLLDELRLEPELTVKFTLLKPSEDTRGKFWDLEEVGSGDARKLRVKSLINNDIKSFRFLNPRAIGSETFEAPSCKISMKPGFAANKGFTAECTAKLLFNEKDGYLFDFGVVADPLEVTPKSLDFTSAADSTGKTITATATGTVTANSNQAWATPTVAGKVTTVKVTANTGAARTANITISADGKTSTVRVTQAGV